MSDYGVFEASTTDGHEEEQRQRQATRDLGRAIEAAREGFGDFLSGATDKQDYSDRLALVMNDLMQKVADSGVMPVPGVMRKVKAALRPQFRTAKSTKDMAYEFYKQLADIGFTGEELADPNFDWDQDWVQDALGNAAHALGVSEEEVVEATGEYSPTSSSFFAKRKTAGDLEDFESWVSEEANSVYDLASASRYLSTFPSGEEPFDNDPDALLYAYEFQFAEASRKRAYFNPDITDDNLLGALQIAEVLLNAAPGDQERIDKVDELRAEVDARGLTPLKTSRLKRAYDSSSTPGMYAEWASDQGLDPHSNETVAEFGNQFSGLSYDMQQEIAQEFLSSRKQAGTTGGGEEVDLSNPSSLSDEDLIYWASSAGGSYVSDSESDSIHAEVRARGLEQQVRDVQNYKVDWTPPDKYNYFGNRKALRKQAFTQENLGNGYYGIFYSAPSGKTDVDIFDSGDSLLTELTGADSPEMARKQAVEYVDSISSPEFTSSRKVAVQWRFDDMGMPEFDWVSWWTVPEESAEASNGVQGLVVEDGTGQGGYNWSIQDIATSDDLQNGNAASVEQAKAEVEQAMSRYASRKTALKWKDTDFNSWVKMDGGAWSLEVEETGGNFWVYFNGGPADGQMEQLSASSMEEAKAEAESIASSNGITASRKTAAETFQPGDKVMKSGYPGTVQNEYMEGMYEVRMERGTVVVPAEELTRVSSRRTASIDELQAYVESKGVAATPVGTGFEFPLPTGADGEIFENRNGDFIVQTLVSGGGGISSLYTKDEVAAIKGWIDASLSGRAAGKQASADDLFPGWGELLDEFDYFFEKQVGSPLGDSDMGMEEVRSILNDFFRANPDMTEEEQVETAELLGITASRKVAVQWEMKDYGMGDLGYESWETVPEDSAEAAVGTYGIVTHDATGQGGYNWSVVDPNDSGEWIAQGNEATVDAAKAAAERAL